MLGRILALFSSLAAAHSASALPPSAGKDPEQIAFFEKRIRPLLAEHCYECHSSTSSKLKGGLALDTQAGWMDGGDSGEVIVPGEPEMSLLIRSISHRDEDLQMPPKHYGPAFLPASFQGTRISTGKGSISNIANPSIKPAAQRRQLDLVQSMNQDMLARNRANAELEGVIESYELAFRMQTSVPGVMDLSKESQSTKNLYGIGAKATNDFGTQCLMARRLAEAGVRFIQVTHRGWDQHNNLSSKLKSNCGATDKPIAALITDLKRRGLLKDTLIVWGGEFGRSPQGQNKDGRRHNNRGYSMWMAGGGVQGGLRYGSTDELGGQAVQGKMHTHDLHATILHLLGLDHEKLTYRYAGRDFRLTDVHGIVNKDILA